MGKNDSNKNDSNNNSKSDNNNNTDISDHGLPSNLHSAGRARRVIAGGNVECCQAIGHVGCASQKGIKAKEAHRGGGLGVSS